jgi:hypothetical protein
VARRAVPKRIRRGAPPEEVYSAVYAMARELVEGARGRAVTLRPSMFGDSPSVVMRVSRLLHRWCGQCNCTKIANRRFTKFVFSVECLRRLLCLGGLDAHRKAALAAVRLPSSWLRLVDMLVEAGRYKSRSEAVRAAIERLIEQHKCAQGGLLKSAEVRGT